jgi:hypothetical protein
MSDSKLCHQCALVHPENEPCGGPMTDLETTLARHRGETRYANPNTHCEWCDQPWPCDAYTLGTRAIEAGRDMAAAVALYGDAKARADSLEAEKALLLEALGQARDRLQNVLEHDGEGEYQESGVQDAWFGMQEIDAITDRLSASSEEYKRRVRQEAGEVAVEAALTMVRGAVHEMSAECRDPKHDPLYGGVLRRIEQVRAALLTQKEAGQ